MVCDWKTLFENEGAGGAVIAVVWAVWSWLKSRKTSTAK
jgi:hypothetical protein